MPELPEVETLCRQLQKKIAGEKITATEVCDPKLAHLQDLRGRTVRAVRRNGKMVEIILDHDDSVFIHLRMTGRLLWNTKGDKPKHSRWRMFFTGADVYLVDPRRFATVRIVKTQDMEVDNDLMLKFDQQAFVARHGRRKTAVKNLIMDQNAVAGIGNIYACEILHCSGINPARSAATLTPEDWRKIFSQAKRILRTAIKKRGTSISDWRDLKGCQGENQYELKAYGQDGKACSYCGSVIKRVKQGGRSTYYCPACQK